MHSNGYRVINEAGKMVYLHRRAWEDAHGPIPADMVVHHICHRKGCVNIEHLQLVTKREHGLIHTQPISVCTKCGSTERIPIRTRPGKHYCGPCARERQRARGRKNGWPHKDHRIGAPLILCACGCGKEIPSKRKDGRDAMFAQGHNMRVNPWHGRRPDPWASRR